MNVVVEIHFYFVEVKVLDKTRWYDTAAQHVYMLCSANKSSIVRKCMWSIHAKTTSKIVFVNVLIITWKHFH